LFPRLAGQQRERNAVACIETSNEPFQSCHDLFIRETMPVSPVALIGWPAIVAAMLLSAAGIRYLRWRWPIIAAIAITPVSLYLAGTPRFAGIALLAPGLLLGVALALRASRIGLAWGLLAVVVGFFACLAFLVGSE
jgi:hypothetical protein